MGWSCHDRHRRCRPQYDRGSWCWHGGKPPAAQEPVGGGEWMTTLIFEVKNVPAALHKCRRFATNGEHHQAGEFQRNGSFWRRNLAWTWSAQAGRR
jgi:hypothetical protein